jgi:hypothetical protein
MMRVMRGEGVRVLPFDIFTFGIFLSAFFFRPKFRESWSSIYQEIISTETSGPFFPIV